MPASFWVGGMIGFLLGLIFKSCPNNKKRDYNDGMKAMYIEMTTRKYGKDAQSIIDAVEKEKASKK
ncbi:MAG: hypothetical protein PHE17_11260 [Thiothrix sp.]|uniref:hypothetical protein n=1 Tax=Thiothrix sp. TaxID=1032 RepID=UPI002613FF1E|nr:hypothetical protein [Thiothrix sp.]MDD5393586.1 hypothetical protein [Thiothrix sp.]